jgi:hypothetical protein
MKAGARDKGVIEDELIDREHDNELPNRIEGKGKPIWYKFLHYNEWVQYLPSLRYIRGSRAKFSITTFDEINKAAQQVFECNKSFFRFRAQVDLLAHYIGTKILEEIYVTQKGIMKDPLSKILEEQESQFLVWDRMKAVSEIFQNLCEKRAQGFITEQEMDEHVDRYISIFESKEDRNKMLLKIDIMLQSGEMFKAKERTRMKSYRAKYEAAEKGISIVSDF